MTKAYAIVVCRDGVPVSSKFISPLSAENIDLFSAMLETLNNYALKLVRHPITCIDVDSKQVLVYQGMESPSILVWTLIDKTSNNELAQKVLRQVFSEFLDRRVETLSKRITEMMEEKSDVN